MDEIDSTHYHLVAGDLRDAKELDQKLLAVGLDKKWVDDYVYIKWLIIYPFTAYLLIAFTSSIVYVIVT